MATVYPIVNSHFLVEWGGSRVGFTEVTGLDYETPPIDYREGNDTVYNVSKLPGMPKYPNIVLKRGKLEADNEFHTWLATIQLNQVERRTLKISILNEEHNPIETWQVTAAFPCKYTGPQLKSSTSEVAVESIEICHEGWVKL